MNETRLGLNYKYTNGNLSLLNIFWTMDIPLVL